MKSINLRLLDTVCVCCVQCTCDLLMTLPVSFFQNLRPPPPLVLLSSGVGFQTQNNLHLWLSFKCCRIFFSDMWTWSLGLIIRFTCVGQCVYCVAYMVFFVSLPTFGPFVCGNMKKSGLGLELWAQLNSRGWGRWGLKFEPHIGYITNDIITPRLSLRSHFLLLRA